MPYIKQNIRYQFDQEIERLASKLKVYSDGNDQLCGNLNYIIFKMVKELTDKNNGGEISYARFNAINGALECCKQEVYRRLIAPYEDTKIEDNGDV